MCNKLKLNFLQPIILKCLAISSVAVFSLGVSMSAYADIITLGDDSKYNIYLASHVGNTWTYSVNEVSGKSLSHWNVGIPSCIEHITDYTPTPGYDTTDGSTDFEGIKWDVAESFTSGTFSVTLDADYPEGTVKAQAKAGSKGNERTGNVMGPNCNTDPLSNVEEPQLIVDIVTPDGVCEVIYGVQDWDLNHSQFVTINVQNQVEALGGIYPGLDIEGLDITKDGSLLIGSTGDESAFPGSLYQVDPASGKIKSLGEIRFQFDLDDDGIDADDPVIYGTEVSAISFHPIDSSLWGWSEECGLVAINLANPAESVLVSPYATDNFIACLSNDKSMRRSYTSLVEDISWDESGDNLYFSEGNRVMVYTLSIGMVKEVRQLKGNVETVELLPWETENLLVKTHNSSAIQTLNVTTGELSPEVIDVGEFTDIEAVAACQTDCEAEWTYAKDSINDSTGPSPESSRIQVGNSYFEIYGIAVKMDSDTVTVAVNSRLPVGGIPYHGKQISWGDIVFDFDGTKYGVRFDTANDSLAGGNETGLYEVMELKSVTKANSGHTNFTSYKNYVARRSGFPSLGDLPIVNNGYFGNRDKMPTSMKSGHKVADIEMLDAAALAALGLDFADNLGIPASTYDSANPFSPRNKKSANELGEYTFGFKFNRQAGMTGKFVAHLFTECGNDGIVMVNEPYCE